MFFDDIGLTARWSYGVEVSRLWRLPQSPGTGDRFMMFAPSQNDCPTVTVSQIRLNLKGHNLLLMCHLYKFYGWMNKLIIKHSTVQPCKVWSICFQPCEVEVMTATSTPGNYPHVHVKYKTWYRTMWGLRNRHWKKAKTCLTLMFSLIVSAILIWSVCLFKQNESLATNTMNPELITYLLC